MTQDVERRLIGDVLEVRAKLKLLDPIKPGELDGIMELLHVDTEGMAFLLGVTVSAIDQWRMSGRVPLEISHLLRAWVALHMFGRAWMPVEGT